MDLRFEGAGGDDGSDALLGGLNYQLSDDETEMEQALDGGPSTPPKYWWIVFQLVILGGVGAMIVYYTGLEDEGNLVRDEIVAELEAVMDRSVDPCEDFYTYACGGWASVNEIPADDNKVSRFYQGGELGAQVADTLLDILDRSDSETSVLFPLYRSCIDTTTVDSLGASPLTPLMDLISQMDSTIASLMGVAAQLSINDVPVLFELLVANDLMEPDDNLVQLSQRGLGLPSLDMYQDDPLLTQYSQHVSQMLELAEDVTGVPPGGYEDMARSVVDFEQALAQIFLPGQSGDFLKTEEAYNKMTQAELEQLYPLEWPVFFQAVNVDPGKDVNPVQPAYFEALGPFLAQQYEADANVVSWYFRWTLLRRRAALLSADFVQETHRFYGIVLNGREELPPRRSQCLEIINDSVVGLLLGREFAREAFDVETEDASQRMFTSIQEAFIANLDRVDWLDADARASARLKAQRMVVELGQPGATGFPDSSTFPPLSDDTYYDNAAALAQWRFDWKLSRAYTSVDSSQWDLITTPYSVLPQTITAYNAESPNQVIIPAAIHKSPCFNLSWPAAMQYGALGMVDGHELTHGFDTFGRNFDERGALTDWWSEEVAEAFEERARCFAEQYDRYEVQPGITLDGNFTLQENIADNGGAMLAFEAYRMEVGEIGGKSSSILPGHTNDMLFFLQFGQMWCFKMTEEYERLWVQTNQHATPMFRVKGSLSNMPEFAEAYNCPAGSAYAPETRCKIW